MEGDNTQLGIMFTNLIETWETLTEKADLLKVLFLNGTIQSPLMADLVDLLPYVNQTSYTYRFLKNPHNKIERAQFLQMF